MGAFASGAPSSSPAVQEGRNRSLFLALAALSRPRPWRLAAVNAAASFLQCAGPSGRGTRRGRASGNAVRCPAGLSPGKHRGLLSRLHYSSCPTPPPQSPEPCPALVFTWTLILAYSVFTVAGHGWGRIPLSSRSAWMMVLKHNMQSNVLICALEFLLLKKKKKPVQNNHQRHKAFTWT